MKGSKHKIDIFEKHLILGFNQVSNELKEHVAAWSGELEGIRAPANYEKIFKTKFVLKCAIAGDVGLRNCSTTADKLFNSKKSRRIFFPYEIKKGQWTAMELKKTMEGVNVNSGFVFLVYIYDYDPALPKEMKAFRHLILDNQYHDAPRFSLNDKSLRLFHHFVSIPYSHLGHCMIVGFKRTPKSESFNIYDQNYMTLGKQTLLCIKKKAVRDQSALNKIFADYTHLENPSYDDLSKDICLCVGAYFTEQENELSDFNDVVQIIVKSNAIETLERIEKLGNKPSNLDPNWFGLANSMLVLSNREKFKTDGKAVHLVSTYYHYSLVALPAQGYGVGLLQAIGVENLKKACLQVLDKVKSTPSRYEEQFEIDETGLEERKMTYNEYHIQSSDESYGSDDDSVVVEDPGEDGEDPGWAYFNPTESDSSDLSDQEAEVDFVPKIRTLPRLGSPIPRRRYR